MKIAFVAAQDPSNSVQFFSGIPYHLFWALRSQTETIPLAVNVAGPPTWWHFYSRLLGKVTGAQPRWGMRSEVMKALADNTARQVTATGADVVLTVGQGHLVFWNSSLPGATFSDILYGSVPAGGFPHDSVNPRRLNGRQQAQLKLYAQRAADNSVRVFVTSVFSLEGARWFGTKISSDKAVITQIGANFREAPTTIEEPRPSSPLRLLWLGTNWERKGGPKALVVLDKLVGMGLAVELHLVGRIPETLNHPHVIRHGFLDKGVPEEGKRLADIYRHSHLLLLPTQKDFTPSGLAEAAAYGVPAVTTPVGGIPGMFAEDEVILLPYKEYVENAPQAIMALLENDRLPHMARRVRRRFETALNWDVIAEKIVAELAMTLNL